VLFSSVTFVYYFLPVSLALYFLTPRPNGSQKYRNIVLLITSLVFYAWGEPAYILLMAAQCVVAWALGFPIYRYRGRPASLGWTIVSVVLGFGGLVFFKYTDFVIANVNALLHSRIGLLGLALPIGISFYTFHIQSYTIDLYRGKFAPQRNLITFATYVAMFPALVAGPIVRYQTVAVQLDARDATIARFAGGAQRFVVGLAKKVLIANTMGELVVAYKAAAAPSTLFAWLYVLAFALQIYFDFSGYSDMALGLARVFGFDLPENFRYPYIAASITDFWRRWHISMSSWFRDYAYIPLGGNRVSVPRHLLNIALVWALTGLWHGAAWNFVLWGMYFAVWLIVEKYVLARVMRRWPAAARHAYAMLLVGISWVIFDAGGLAEIGATLARLAGAGGAAAGPDALYYLRSYALPLVVAVIGCTPWPARLGERISRYRAATILSPLATGALLLLATAYLVDGSFNPFIYFRF